MSELQDRINELTSRMLQRELYVVLTTPIKRRGGSRRVAIAGTFSTSPLRTVLAPFKAHGSPVVSIVSSLYAVSAFLHA